MSIEDRDVERAEAAIEMEEDMHKGHRPSLSESTSKEKVADKIIEEVVERVPFIRPVMCTLVICLGSYNFGTTVAWPSSAIPNLNDNLNPFFVTSDQNSWIGSIMALGALVGALIGGPYSDKVGRKLALISVQIVFAIGWVIISASTNFPCMLTGRAITGLAVGAVSVTCPVFIGEISPAKIRGLLGSCNQLFIVTGIFMSYVFGSFTPWNYMALYAICFNCILSIVVSFIPESPRWLLANGQKKAAEESLQWLRGEGYDIRAELAYMDHTITTEAQEKGSIRDFAKPELWKPLIISLFLMLFQQFSGINAILTYMVDIFRMAGSDLDPNTQSIAVGAVGIVGTLVSVFVIDLAGRRILLTVSAIVMSLSIGGMGAFFYEQHLDEDYANNTLSWLPLVCLIVFNFGFNWAFGPVPWLMIGELFPQKAKGIAVAIATVGNWLFAFLMTQFFNDMSDAMGVYGAYWFCCGFCVLAIPFSMFVATETKGKTLEQIQESFK